MKSFLDNPTIDSTLHLSEVVDYFGRILPYLHQLENTPQDSEWHAEGNVFIHTDLVLQAALNEAKDLTEPQRLVLALAACFHDIAKPVSTRTAEIDGRERIVSPRHAAIGRNYLLTQLVDSEIPPNVVHQVVALVGHHHDPRKLIADDHQRSSYARLARLCDLELLYHLCRADMLGRECPDQDTQIEQIELFKLQAQEWQCWKQNPYDGWLEAIQDAFPNRASSFHQHAFAQAIADYETGTIQSIHEALARAWKLPEKTYTLTLLCGASGSGKSTWIESNTTCETIISLDDLREEITGKRDDQSKNGQVMQLAKERLKQALRNKEYIIWDATNTRIDGRNWVASLGTSYGAFTKIVCLQNSTNTLLKRNRKREHPIPTNVLMKQIERMEWPLLDEADQVCYLPPKS